MSPIDSIKNRLTPYPNIRYEKRDGGITVFPADDSGFEVSFWIGSDEYIVSFFGWQEHFTAAKDALSCFAFGLSDQCRLKVSYRGSLPHQWTLEHVENGKWIEDSTTGLLLFPFWHKPEIRYLQNRLLRDEVPKHTL